MEKDPPATKASENAEISPENTEISPKTVVNIAKKGIRRILAEPKDSKSTSEKSTKDKAKKTPEEPESPSMLKAEKTAKNFIESRIAWFRIFSGDGSLAYLTSKKAKTFAFYPGKGKVEFPTKWFDKEAEVTYREKELEFSSAHELCHFMDMRENPEEYLRNFDRMESEAEKKAKEYCKTHPEADPKKVKKIIHTEIHLLYNCLDDIYVNSLAASLAPTFKTNGRSSVVSLYKKLGYDDADLTQIPLHLQMAYALLRDEMIGEECGKSLVNDEVRDILDQKPLIGTSLRDRIKKQLKPRPNKKKNKNVDLIDPKTRYEIIRKYFEPKYFELLFKDLNELLKDEKQQQDNEPGDEGEDSNEPGEPTSSIDNNAGNDTSSEDNSGNDSEGEDGSEPEETNSKNGEGEEDESDNEDGGNGEDANSDKDDEDEDEDDPFGKYKKKKFFSDHNGKETKRALDEFKEEKDVEKMDNNQRNEYKGKKIQEKFDRDHGIDAEERKAHELAKEKISKAREIMKTFWDNLIGKSIELQKKTIYQQKKGKIDLDHPVKTFIELTESINEGHPEDARIYTKTETERVPVDKPDEIQISLLVDCSGSMSSFIGNSSLTQIAKDTTVLLMLSIMDFNHKLDGKRRETGSKLTAKTEVIGFGDSDRRIKSFEKQRVSNKEEAELIKTVSRITCDDGDTIDATSLQEINSSISEKDKKRIKEGKLLKIVFEITDGESHSKDATKQAVASLNEKGVLTFGFQIGAKNDTFESIWNDGPTGKKMGINIGDNPNRLPEQLINLLTEILKDIKI